MTNGERARRHMSHEAHCPRCGTILESGIHAIRDCPFSRNVWLSVLPMAARNSFFSQPIYEWLIFNLQSTQRWGKVEVEWQTPFSLAPMEGS